MATAESQGIVRHFDRYTQLSKRWVASVNRLTLSMNRRISVSRCSCKIPISHATLWVWRRVLWNGAQQQWRKKELMKQISLCTLEVRAQLHTFQYQNKSKKKTSNMAPFGHRNFINFYFRPLRLAVMDTVFGGSCNLRKKLKKKWFLFQSN